MNKAWKRMSSGKYIDLNAMVLGDIDIGDIDTSLNHTYRFYGHFKDMPPLTVAQHTLLCVNLADMLFPGDRKVMAAVIIHDFGEAYYGDVSSPVKALLGEEYRNFTKPIDSLINNKFWIDPSEKGPSEQVHQCVKICDYLSLDIERRSMWKSQMGKDKWPDTPDLKLSLLDKQALFDEVAGQYVDLERLLEDV